MDVDSVTKWVTLAGALVGAVAGAWSLFLQLRGKRDSFKVGMGTISPEAIREECLHVVSKSDHPIRIADYGFISADGQLKSIQMEADLGSYMGQEGLFRGSSMLEKRGDALEVGYCMRNAPIGCFALTNLQSRPKLAFRYDTPRWKRAKVRMQTYWKGKAYLQ